MNGLLFPDARHCYPSAHHGYLAGVNLKDILVEYDQIGKFSDFNRSRCFFLMEQEGKKGGEGLEGLEGGGGIRGQREKLTYHPALSDTPKTALTP